MKKCVFLLLGAGILCLPSCRLLGLLDTETGTKSIGLYALEGESSSLESRKIKDLKMTYKQGEGMSPYFTLEQYAGFYEAYFDAKADSEVQHSTNEDAWIIKLDGEAVFVAYVDYSKKTMQVGGSISNAFRSVPGADSIFSYQMNYNSQNMTKSNGFDTYDFSGVSTFKKGGSIYYPLGLLDTTFSSYSNIYHGFDYANVFAFADNESLSEVKYLENKKECSFYEHMVQNYQRESSDRYIMEMNRDLFFYVMDNMYGLNTLKGFTSMKTYCSSFLGDFLSTDGTTRGKALCRALNLLDDDHTGLLAPSYPWGEQQGIVERGTNSKKRSATMRQLKTLRGDPEEQPETKTFVGPSYSLDGKTASFIFGEFIVGTAEKCLTGRGFTSEAWAYDSYAYFLKQFDLIKERASVENVVIDMSLNGGGVIGALMKLLALISDDNLTAIDFYNPRNDFCQRVTSMVDSNGDGYYDTGDALGSQYHIYLLTSDCSFSCGNALPFYAKEHGVKTIGKKTGGGECSVGSAYLPNGQFFVFSSNDHIGKWDTMQKTFTGDEPGVTPDIEIPYEFFYDVNYLSARILAAN